MSSSTLRFTSVYNFKGIELHKVLIFMKANEHKLYMNPSEIGQYKIDPEQVEKVLKNIDEQSCLSTKDKEDSKLFLRRIIEIMKYVDFNEFLCIIIKMSKEIEQYLLDNHTNYQAIFFCGLDSSISKSYTWILFLFLNEMYDFFMKNPIIRDKIFVCNENIKIDFNESIKYLYLFFDDMSYSGSQISNILNYHFLYYNNSKGVSEPLPNVDIFITTPFISKTAKSILIVGKFNYWHSTIIINTLYEQFINNIEEPLLTKYNTIYNEFCKNHKYSPNSGFSCKDSIIPIYFDHKIADSWSTFNKLLYFGSYPINSSSSTCTPNCIKTNLIKKCSSTTFHEHILEKNFCLNKFQDISNEQGACPKTFYKNIIYILPNSPPLETIIRDLNEYKYDSISLIKLLKYYDNLKLFPPHTNHISTFSTPTPINPFSSSALPASKPPSDYLKKYLKYKNKYIMLKQKFKK